MYEKMTWSPGSYGDFQPVLTIWTFWYRVTQWSSVPKVGSNGLSIFDKTIFKVFPWIYMREKLVMPMVAMFFIGPYLFSNIGRGFEVF